MNYVFSFFDLWPYVLIILVFFFCYIVKPKNTSKILYLTLFIFSALRYDVGWDYMSYVSEIESGYDAILNSRYEFLSKYVFLIGGYLDFYPIVFIIFAYLILKTTYFCINRYSINPLLSWLVFYSMPLFFFASLSTLRQSLATVILFYSYRFAIEKKYIWFFSTILIGCLFHVSAIVGILILPLILLPLGRKMNIILFISSFFVGKFISIFLNSINLGATLTYYLNNETYKSTMLQYVYYLIGVFNLLFFNRLIKISPRNKEFITLSNFGLVVFNVLSFEPVSAGRISAFFLIFWTFLIPYYIRLFDIKTSKVVSSILVVSFVSLSIFYIYIYINSYNNGILEKISFIPYKFWINNL